MVVTIWVGDTQKRKRLYLQFFHRAGIFRGGLVIVAGKVKQGVDDQVRGMIFHGNGLLYGFA